MGGEAAPGRLRSEQTAQARSSKQKPGLIELPDDAGVAGIVSLF
jgi:hypothetical protein